MTTARESDQIVRARLRTVLVEQFNREELETLCSDIQDNLLNDGTKLPLSLDIVGGETHEGRCRNLIAYLERRNYRDYLERAVAQMRPNASRGSVAASAHASRSGSAASTQAAAAVPDDASGTALGTDLQQPTLRSPVDVMIATALTEEHQVVLAVLDKLATRVGKHNRSIFWRYRTPHGDYTIAAVSAHALGSISMGGATGPWLQDLRPQFAVLVGIAAAVKTKGLQLGYVPFANQIVGYGDMAIQGGKIEFRSAGFPVDPKLYEVAGEIRSDPTLYIDWQVQCRSAINAIIPKINLLRATKIVEQTGGAVCDPHLVVGVTASGPFLLRDADFRDKLADFPKDIPETTINQLQVAGPVHPKLISAEMEAHGFMEACHHSGVAASVLKGISDLGDADKAKLETESGGFYRAYACSNAVVALLHMLRQKPRPPLTGRALMPA